MYDVTLVCDDEKQIGAHKNVKSISSTSILIAPSVNDFHSIIDYLDDMAIASKKMY